MFYSEQRSPIGWSAQLTPDAPHNATETDGEQTVRNISGTTIRLRNVRRVPEHMIGASIDAIRAALFAPA
jgi:hypothetical protein